MKKFLEMLKIKNKSAFRHGTYSAVVIAVVLVGVIVLNLLMGMLSDRGVLSFDITQSKTNTLDEKNVEYIKSVDKEITVTVLATEDDYGSTLNNYAGQYLNVLDDSGYYAQTVKILKRYEQLNKKIKVVFEDFYSNKTESFLTDYPNLFYGDIVVECDNKTRHIAFDDIYTYSDETGYAAQGYGSYYVDANNVETAVSSAIHALSSGDPKKMALIASHSTADIFEKYYADTLKYNNFEITKITETVVQKIPTELDVLVIAAPTNDLFESEVTVINEWLLNGGKMDKSLIFIPGNTMANKPVLKQFLAEWGVKYTDGILYQTDSNYSYNGDAAIMPFFISTNDVSKKIAPKTGGYSLVGSNLVMSTAYETFGSRKAYTVVSTNDTVTIAPEGFDTKWEPASSAKKGIYSGVIITEEEEIIDNERHTSCVVAFSSQEFIYSTWAADSRVQNMEIATNCAMFISGMNDNKMTFLPKTIETNSFVSEITDGQTAAIRIIFVIIVPVLVAALGVVVWVRRKRK